MKSCNPRTFYAEIGNLCAKVRPICKNAPPHKYEDFGWSCIEWLWPLFWLHLRELNITGFVQFDTVTGCDKCKLLWPVSHILRWPASRRSSESRLTAVTAYQSSSMRQRPASKTLRANQRRGLTSSTVWHRKWSNWDRKSRFSFLFNWSIIYLKCYWLKHSRVMTFRSGDINWSIITSSVRCNQSWRPQCFRLIMCHTNWKCQLLNNLNTHWLIDWFRRRRGGAAAAWRSWRRRARQCWSDQLRNPSRSKICREKRGSCRTLWHTGRSILWSVRFIDQPSTEPTADHYQWSLRVPLQWEQVCRAQGGVSQSQSRIIPSAEETEGGAWVWGRSSAREAGGGGERETRWASEQTREATVTQILLWPR